MSKSTAINIDEERIKLEAERNYAKMHPLWAWIAKGWILQFAGFLLALLLVDVFGKFAGVQVLPWWGWGLLIRVSFATLAATTQTWLMWKLANRSVEERCRDVEKLWSALTGAAWLKNVAYLGIAMAIAVGVPVGSLLAWILSGHELSAGSPILTVVLFVVASLFWTLPMAMIFRYGGVRQLKKYVLTPA